MFMSHLQQVAVCESCEIGVRKSRYAGTCSQAHKAFSLSLPFASSDKCLLNRDLPPPYLPRFVRPLLSPHLRISWIRYPPSSCLFCLSSLIPIVFARISEFLVRHPNPLLSQYSSLSVGVSSRHSMPSNRVLLKLLFELLVLWLPSFVRGMTYTRCWVS